MDRQHDELTDTGILKIQVAARAANERFLAHFIHLTRARFGVDQQIDVEFCAADFCVQVLA